MRRILLLAGIWGWSFLLIKVSVAGMTPPTMACLRIGLGAVALLVVCRVRGQSLPRDSATWGHMTVMGLMYGVLPFTLLGWGEQRTTSALAAVSQADTPLFTAVFAAWLLSDRIKRPQTIGLVIGFVGVGVGAGIALGDLAKSSTIGSLAEAASGACYGFAFTYARRYLGRVDPLVAATGQLLTGFVLALPLAVITTATSGFSLSPTRAVAIVLLGVVSTGIAYALNYGSIAAVGPTKASTVTYLVPVVAVIVGIIALGEPFQTRVITGGVIIAVGIALVQDRTKAIRRIPVVGTALATLLLGACSGGGSAPLQATGCAAPHHDAFDPHSTVHVLPGAPTPSYLTNPPTSGVHQPINVPSYRGVRTASIAPQIQVGLLESSQVLVQYRPPIEPTKLVALTANKLVTVAPNPSLPAPVVATAWTWRLECTAPTPAVVAALQSFVAAHAGNGPQSPPP